MRDQLVAKAAEARAAVVEGKPWAELTSDVQARHRHAAEIELKLYTAVIKDAGFFIAPKKIPDDIAYQVGQDITVGFEGHQLALSTATVQDYWAGCVAGLETEGVTNEPGRAAPSSAARRADV